ncbi:winged helix-turn-helix domain-containing protein [Lacinutrix iliipiscaria]|uniref:Winged helix-turn-helix domain-containing protein n=1 Tax=Lacinutrix iliipiscaria TaxID=1230532 RepID=A0ABW5WL21_9FLAO
MSRRFVFLFVALIVILFSLNIVSCSRDIDESFSERVKISLRDVGHQLLLENQDSTSLVLPIIELNRTNYKLSFQNQLSFEPSRLVSIVDSAFLRAELSKYYRVEVIQCSDLEVAYSYEMNAEKEKTIIPCSGRNLPSACYTIEVKFSNLKTTSNEKMLLYILSLAVLFLLGFLIYKRKPAIVLDNSNQDYNTIGCFRFYPEQNKLVKEATEINLSKKECELLAIFVAHPNQIIKRDELTKRVWEDHGVIVGRSLDTYISKLRKILKDDESIKLTNVHGVGYKLETL